MQISMSRFAAKSAFLALGVVATFGQAKAEPGDRKLLGKAGDWKNTVAGTTLKNRLYTVETDGSLYNTDLKTGKWQKVGKSGFAKTKFLFTTGAYITALESDGSLYRVNPVTGQRLRLGKAGDWKDTIKGTTVNGNIYTVEKTGELYRTDGKSGQWAPLGNPDFGGTTVIAGRNKAGYAEAGLFTIEGDGSLYTVNPADGTWKNLGKPALWKGSIAAVIVPEADTLYVVNDKGALQWSILAAGADVKPLPLGKPIYKKTQFLFVGYDDTMPWLYCIDSDGSLYAVEMAPMVG
jgi:hypothetical protein